MIYEFALEPALVARWHDRNRYLFFDEKFGLRARRVVAAYPRNWKRLVWEAFGKSPAAGDQNAQMRMTELIQHLSQNSVRRPSTFPEIPSWLARAEAEHSERPFRAIIATINPRNRSFVITDRELVETGHALWNIPDGYPTPRNAAEIANAVLPLMQLCRHAVIIEPYFDPGKQRFRRTLAAILATCGKNVCGLKTVQVELHTSIDRFFEDWERGEFRDLNEETKVYQYYASECRSRIPSLVPKGVEFRVIVWKRRTDGEKLHNRYLLTNIYGVIFGTGSDESENPDSKESDDIVLLEEGQYLMRYKQYTGTPPAFDRVGESIPIAPQKT
ncbi:MAG: hypothetical protein JSW39_16015 [Desulfobacterales bacterium]|nr:MAG: hypothetical protein JSW39_16015 [Desulfobacterales bacterium]